MEFDLNYRTYHLFKINKTSLILPESGLMPCEQRDQKDVFRVADDSVIAKLSEEARILTLREFGYVLA